MGSSTPKNTTTTTKQEPPSWAVPQYQNLLNRASWVSNQEYTPYGGQQIAGFTPDQISAQDLIRHQTTGATWLGDQSRAYTQNLLSGQGQYTPGVNPYSGQNPYLNQMIDATTGDITRAYSNITAPGISSAFNSSGAYGGTAHQQALAESQRQLAGELGQAVSGLRSQDYDRQVGLAEADINRRTDIATDYQARQLQALALAPQTQQLGFTGANMLANIGGAQQGLNQSILDQNYANFLEGRDWRTNQLGILGQALGTINGGFMNGTSTAPNLNRPNPWAGALGGAAAGAAAGSVIPVVGTGVGALIGAGLGYFGSR